MRSPAIITLSLNVIQIPYQRRYRTVLGEAFDVYLAILRIVDKQIREALGRDTPNWRVMNACPPCTYKVCFVLFLMPRNENLQMISSRMNLHGSLIG